jgi:hypothetical protein
MIKSFYDITKNEKLSVYFSSVDDYPIKKMKITRQNTIKKIPYIFIFNYLYYLLESIGNLSSYRTKRIWICAKYRQSNLNTIRR